MESYFNLKNRYDNLYKKKEILEKENEELKKVFEESNKGNSKKLYAKKKQELVLLINYYKNQIRLWELKTNIESDYIKKEEIMDKISFIEILINEFKEEKEKSKTKKEEEFWTQEIINLIKQKNLLNNLIN